MASSTTRVKTALYVDFDNIYLGLREDSPAAAEQFATAPDRWLRWIEEGMGMQGEGGAERAVLVRRCYLNPDAFSRYRAYFTRSGFSVVDCPSLTKRGKSSSDIVMVMDMLDALQHETRFDEFVIMSADADFTPVLQRLRMHDRRTAVLVSGMAAPAYRAGCDLLISEDTFIESALGIVAEEPSSAAPPRAPAPPSASRADLLDAIALRVYEEASANGTLPATDLPRIYREFREFTPTSSWLGFFSLRGLTEAVVARRPELRILEGETTWRVGVGVAEAEADPRPAAGGNGRDELRRRIVARVGELVAQSAEGVGMAKAAHQVVHDFGADLLETHWLGAGTFKNLLAGAGDLPFAIFTGSGGLLYDPERHPRPEERAPSDPLSNLPEPLATFIARVNRLTEAPRLGPAQYRLLFEVIAKELGRAPYNLMGTGKAVRDQCVERGESIARQSVTFVLRGLAYVGYPLFRADRGHDAAELARAFRGNLVNLLRQAQAEVGDADLEMLDAWLVVPFHGGDPAPPPDPPAAGEDEDRELAAASVESANG